MSTACSPDQVIEAPTPRKSNRVPISLAAWLTALSTSWRSSLDTMSKEDSCDATAPRLDAADADRHAECPRTVPLQRHGCFTASRAPSGLVMGYPSLSRAVAAAT